MKNFRFTRFRTLTFVVTLALTLLPGLLFSQPRSPVPDKPSSEKLYYNFSKAHPDFISEAEAEKLNAKLEEFARTTSNQILVLIIDDLGGMDPIDFTTTLGRKWGIGQEKQKNGVILMVQPDERVITIAVGYGLEGAITDIHTQHVRDDRMAPFFKKEQYYEGLDAGVTALMELAKGEYSQEVKGKSKFPWKYILIAIILIIIFSRFGRGFGGGYFIGRGGFGRSGGFGGGFGGGFSGGGGFGGGSFGGGGSSGKW